MPTTEKLRNKLMGKLSELFQLDQPDINFGFYRIMEAKAGHVKSFRDKDLLQIIADAFGQVDEDRKAQLQTNIDREIEAAKAYGVAEPEKSPKVIEAQAEYKALKDGATAEADVYNHLYRFVERYYDQGDFISRRYYARENAGKAAPYAIPYNGEEVKLHWANADQYYIKTAEYFFNYSFDITRAAEIRKMSNGEKILNDIPEKPLKMHFRIVDASEGEHGNVKAAEDKKRFFVLHKDCPALINDDELVVNFEYKALPGGKNSVNADTEKNLKEKFGKSLNKGNMPNLAMAEKIIDVASKLDKAKGYLSALCLPAPTDKISKRPLLAKYMATNLTRDTLNWLKRGFQRKVPKMGRFKKGLFYGVSRLKWIAVPADAMNPNNGQKERILIVWRKLTGNLEQDNLMLDEWFLKYRIATRNFEYDIIYVNGSNNLPNLKKDDENWKVRLIEEEFHKKMWEEA